MTQPFIQDFSERKQQVLHYLAAVKKAERDFERDRTRPFERERTRPLEGRLLVLRAGTFLVLYNLIEATVRGSIDAIHDKVTTSGVPFGQLTMTLRKEVVRLFKRDADPATNHTMDDFPAAFVAVALVDGYRLSGSVDAKAIRKLGSCYGFSCETKREVTRDGSDLLTIKRNRNDLAHGLKTFEEVGRDTPAMDLLLLTRRTLRYMGDITSNIAGYLENEDYLEKVVE